MKRVEKLCSHLCHSHYGLQGYYQTSDPESSSPKVIGMNQISGSDNKDDQAKIKNIVITGVTSGLGRALLDEYVSLGHFVYGCGRRKDRIDKLNNHYGESKAMLSVLDVTNDVAVKKWSDQVFAHLQTHKNQHIDLLINNSGVSIGPKHMWENSKEQFDHVISVSIGGGVTVIRHFLGRMVSVNRGTVINVSSGKGRVPHPLFTPYSCSKMGLESLSKSLALSLPDNMCCCPWAPGLVKTELNRKKKIADASVWAKDAAPFLLTLGPSDNGKSVHTKGYYPQKFMKDYWIIKDGS